MAKVSFPKIKIGLKTESLPVLLAWLLPIWFLPWQSDAISTAKVWLLVLFGIATLLLWSLRCWQEKRVIVTTTAVQLGALAVLATAVLSALFSSNRNWQLQSLEFLPILGMALLVVLGPTTFPHFRWPQLRSAWIGSGSILALSVLLQFLPFHPISTLLSWSTGLPGPTETSVVLGGASLATAVWLAGGGLITWLSRAHEQKKWTAVLGLVQLAAAGALLVATFTAPNSSQLPLPMGTGWSILVDNLKNAKQAAIGNGPDSFSQAFHLGRPVAINGTKIWDRDFRQSSNHWFHIASTIGLLGLTAWVYLAIAAWQLAKELQHAAPGLWWSIILVLIASLLMPLSPLLLGWFGLLLLALIGEKRVHLPNKLKEALVLLATILLQPSNAGRHAQTPPGFATAVAAAGTLLVAVLAYPLGRALAANVIYQQSLRSITTNNAAKAYEQQQQAVTLSPFNPQYRAAYATTNLAIAQGLSQRQNLNQQEQETLAALVQQAIREARALASLHPQDVASWETVGTIYSGLLSVDGAAQWATAATLQAIQLDPVSPLLRLQLGSLYFQANADDQALRYFEQAIQLKPDYANAYYNYGLALERGGNIPVAIQALERALQLLPATSSDRATAENKLAELRKAAESAQAPAQTALPQPAPAGPEGAPDSSSAEQATLPNTTEPVAPTLPTSDIAPEQLPQPSATQQDPNSIVLPENVGF